MSNLSEARAELAEALNDAGFRTVTVVPQTFTPPLCWVAPRDPYRRPGQTFSRKRVQLAVVCLAGPITNDASQDAVDELAESVADKIDAMTAFRLESNEIDAPQLFPTAQGQEFLGAVVNVWCEVERG